MRAVVADALELPGKVQGRRRRVILRTADDRGIGFGRNGGLLPPNDLQRTAPKVGIEWVDRRRQRRADRDARGLAGATRAHEGIRVEIRRILRPVPVQELYGRIRFLQQSLVTIHELAMPWQKADRRHEWISGAVPPGRPEAMDLLLRVPVRVAVRERQCRIRGELLN